MSVTGSKAVLYHLNENMSFVFDRRVTESIINRADSNPDNQAEAEQGHTKPKNQYLKPVRNESGVVVMNYRDRKKSYFNFDPFNTAAYNTAAMIKQE